MCLNNKKPSACKSLVLLFACFVWVSFMSYFASIISLMILLCIHPMISVNTHDVASNYEIVVSLHVFL